MENPTKKEDSKELRDMLNAVVILVAECDGMVDINGDNVHVAIVHDGSGYIPGASMFVSDLNEHDALEGAFEALEDLQAGLQDDEERAEREESRDKGFDTLTETYNGKTFEVSPRQLENIISDHRNRKVWGAVEFYQDTPNEF